MKKITLSVDDKDLETVRIYAAKRKTTVNALIGAYLEQMARQQTQTQAVRARLRVLSEQSRAELGPDYKFDRDSLHER